MTEILLIDGQPHRGKELADALAEHGLRTIAREGIDTESVCPNYACVVALHDRIDPCLADLANTGPVIVLADEPSIPQAVSCIRRGAVDYIPMTVTVPELVAAIERATANPVPAASSATSARRMIGSSEPMSALKRSIAKAAPTDSTVLITGQSGTGKELVARALHAASRRAGAPLISINCATVPPTLIESELFGLEQFDGGQGSHQGLVDAADGGTLFLDEIAELAEGAQARLLRVLQGENRRVGSSVTRSVDVRIIAATHRNLEQLVQSGKFREDLYYRLHVVTFDLPPLRQRQGDILEIAESLLERTCAKLNKHNLSFSSEARQAMLSYAWPGNVRELENAVERAVILSDNDSRITRDLLAIETPSDSPSHAESTGNSELTSLEDYFVRFVLDHQDQLTETELAEKLGISRKSLWERRQRLNIPRRKTRKRGPRRDSATT